MDSSITRDMIDKWRNYLKVAEPYGEEELRFYDGEWNPEREASSSAKTVLEKLGINPYDDDDYGIY